MSDLAPVQRAGDDADDIARLEAEIVSKRERVAQSMGELRHQWNGATSLTRWALSRPVVWIGVGVCLGFIAGYGMRSRRD